MLKLKNNLIIFAGAVLLIFSITIFIYANSKDKNNNIENKKINIIVSILPQIDFVKNIGKDKVEVSAMIPPGFSPATYSPEIEQLKKLSEADLYIRIGYISFEKTQMKRLEDLNPEMTIIDSSKGIEIYENDPHIWMSPRLVKIQVENIYLALVKINPENKEYYQQNKNEYLAELDNLDIELQNSFSKIQNKKILVFHPAFGYLARDYNFQQIAIEIDGKEPSAENLAKIIDMAKKENIKIIFVQKQFSLKSAEAIAKQINGVVVPLDPLSKNYVENLKGIGIEMGK